MFEQLGEKRTDDLLFIALLLVAVSIQIAASLLLVSATPLWFRDSEELINATSAREILLGHGRHLLHFQYMDFCGGCTAVSVMGAGAFALGGERFIVWKLVPIGIGSFQLCLGALLCRTLLNTAAGVAFAFLFALAPTLIAQSASMAWGNHYEVMLFVLAQALTALCIQRNPARSWPWLWWGCFAGLGLWFCLTSSFAFPFTALFLALTLSWRELVSRRLVLLFIGLLVGLGPLLLFHLATGGRPLAVLSSNTSGVESWIHPEKAADIVLWSLHPVLNLTPDHPHEMLGTFTWLGVIALSIPALMGGRRLYLPIVLWCGAALQYFIAPLRIDVPPAGAVPTPIAPRYLMPVAILWLLLAALGAGVLWARGRWARSAAVFLTCGLLALGAAARRAWIAEAEEEPVRPVPEDVAPYCYALFDPNALARLPDSVLVGWDARERISYVNARRSLGWRRVGDFLRAPTSSMPEFLERVRLLGVESPLVFQGLGLGLSHESRYGALPPERWRPKADALLHLLSKEEAEGFALGLWTGNPALAAQPNLRVGTCLLCPALGVAESAPVTIGEDFLPDDILTPSGRTWLSDASMRPALLTGAAASLGHARGFQLAEFQRVTAHLPPWDRRALMRGFLIGRSSIWAMPSPSEEKEVDGEWDDLLLPSAWPP